MINIPTLKDLYDDIIADLEAEFAVTFPIFGKLMLRAIAAVQAAKLKLFYLQIARVQKNIFADSADRDTLIRFGLVKLNRTPFPATQGQYTCTVTGTNGSTIPAQTTFKANDDSSAPGKLYILDTAYTLSGSSGSITLRALEAGSDSRLSVTDQLTSTSPINGVDSSATVTAESVTSTDAEDIEDYRAKVLEAYRLEPQGGAASDYRVWGLDAANVVNIYPYAKSGAPNEVDVFVEATVSASTDGHGTPGSTILADVAACIEQDPDTTKPLSERGRRPLAVFAVNVQAVTPKAIVVTITNYLNLDATKQAAITSAITELIDSIRPFISGADALENKNDILSSNNLISAILGAVPGSVFSAVTFTVAGGGSVSTQTFSQGNIPYFSSISFA